MKAEIKIGKIKKRPERFHALLEIRDCTLIIPAWKILGAMRRLDLERKKWEREEKALKQKED